MRIFRPILAPPDLAAGTVSGLLYVLAFPPFERWYTALIFLIPILVRCSQHTCARQSFWTGCFAGFIGWLGLIFWLCHSTGVGMTLLVCVLALYWGVFLLAANRLRGKPFRWLLLPVVWVFLESVRSIGYLAFAWGLAGQALGSLQPLLELASVAGALPLSMLAVLVNVGLSELLEADLATGSTRVQAWLECAFGLKPPYTARPLGHAAAFLALLLFAIAVVLGTTLYPPPEDRTKGEQLCVAAIQGNYPLDEKYEEDVNATLDRYLGLSRSAQEEGAELAVWPESTLTWPLRYWPSVVNRLQDFVNETGMYLLVGSVDADLEGEEELLYNSAFLFRPGLLEKMDRYPCDLSALQRYDKIHLVPWGEMVPLGRWWPFSLIESVIESAGGGVFVAGTEVTVFEGPRGCKFGVSICFESTLSGLARRQRKLGAGFLVNITNDAWFKKTTAPYQHLQHCVFRAVENRCWVVRAANTGFSAIIDPWGNIVAKTSLFEQGYVVATIYVRDP
ncbi:MAG: apolipoprotein N-acyltransferase [bacterium]